METSTSAEQVAEFYNAQATKVEFEKEDEDAF